MRSVALAARVTDGCDARIMVGKAVLQDRAPGLKDRQVAESVSLLFKRLVRPGPLAVRDQVVEVGPVAGGAEGALQPLDHVFPVRLHRLDGEPVRVDLRDLLGERLDVWVAVVVPRGGKEPREQLQLCDPR
jgi:hypothetical protein